MTLQLLLLGCVAAATPNKLADVLAVEPSGEENAWLFAVTLRSPDTGCDAYADWWEVVSEGGELLYRRVLHHSHVDEQPFTRSGGAVPVAAGQVVIVRAHMNVGGYGGVALRGSPGDGFEPVALADGWAGELAEVEPLPSACAY